MKNFIYIIGNRFHDLPVCSAVPQPLRHRVPLLASRILKKGRFLQFLQTTKALRENTGLALLCFYTSVLEGVRGQRHVPAAFYPREIHGTHSTEGWQGRSGQVRKISPPPGFDPRTVQPVASHNTDRDTWPTDFKK
jgi:hypothetical protein